MCEYVAPTRVILCSFRLVQKPYSFADSPVTIHLYICIFFAYPPPRHTVDSTSRSLSTSSSSVSPHSTSAGVHRSWFWVRLVASTNFETTSGLDLTTFIASLKYQRQYHCYSLLPLVLQNAYPGRNEGGPRSIHTYA